MEGAPRLARGDRAAGAGGAGAAPSLLGDARRDALGELEELVVGEAGQQRARRGARRAATRPADGLVAQRLVERPSSTGAAGARAAARSDERRYARRRGRTAPGAGRARRPASAPRPSSASTSPASRRSVVVGDAAAQQLERDHGDGLVQDQPVELRQAAGVLDARPARPAAAPASAALGRRGHRQRERARRELGVRRRERRARRRAARASRSSRRQRRDRLGRQLAAERALRQRLAAAVEDERPRRR